jgi:hypothetical protein
MFQKKVMGHYSNNDVVNDLFFLALDAAKPRFIVKNLFLRPVPQQAAYRHQPGSSSFYSVYFVGRHPTGQLSASFVGYLGLCNYDKK